MTVPPTDGLGRHLTGHQAVVFDLDGTLVDSTQAVLRAWRTWAGRAGVDVARLDSVVHGRSAAQAISMLLPTLGDDVAAHVREVLHLQEIDVDPAYPVDGAAALIEAIGTTPWAVVTGCSRKMAASRLAAGGLPVPPVLVTDEDVTAGKPDPAGYLLALRRLGVAPHAAIAVEDAPAGIAAAKAAGLWTIAVAQTHPVEELLGADAVVGRLGDITARSLNGTITLTLSEGATP